MISRTTSELNYEQIRIVSVQHVSHLPPQLSLSPLLLDPVPRSEELPVHMIADNIVDVITHNRNGSGRSCHIMILDADVSANANRSINKVLIYALTHT